jgi:hypothetical protein
VSREVLDEGWELIDEHISALVGGHRQYWVSVCDAFAPLKVRAAKM